MKHTPAVLILASCVGAVTIGAQRGPEVRPVGESGSTAPVVAFRTGLTATVARMESNRCATVTLRWMAFPSASSYGVQVSVEPDRGWHEIDHDAACRAPAPTPAPARTQTLRVAATPTRRFFRVTALDSAGKPLDFTSPLLVELR